MPKNQGAAPATNTGGGSKNAQLGGTSGRNNKAAAPEPQAGKIARRRAHALVTTELEPDPWKGLSQDEARFNWLRRYPLPLEFKLAIVLALDHAGITKTRNGEISRTRERFEHERVLSGWFSQSKLAAELGTTRQGISAALRKGAKLGMYKVTTSRGRGNATAFELTIPLAEKGNKADCLLVGPEKATEASEKATGRTKKATGASTKRQPSSLPQSSHFNHLKKSSHKSPGENDSASQGESDQFEQQHNGNSPAPLPQREASNHPEFNELFDRWPNADKDRDLAFRAWINHVVKRDVDPALVLRVAKQYWIQWNDEFVPYIGKWIKEHGWEVEPELSSDEKLNVKYFDTIHRMDQADSSYEPQNELERFILNSKREIEKQREQPEHEDVIDEFNDRFFVPFTLEPKNRTELILGNELIIDLDFTYHDGKEDAKVERGALLTALSSGERKAFYILQVLFEIATRRNENRETLVVVDDLADSFDYQNKYAIIQYLKDISEDGLFKQLIMTHNFDFFRTIESRFVGYSHCLMAAKNKAGVALEQATGIKNVFVNDWKKEFYTNPKKKIASIPFLRNLVEFTKGETDPNFVKLTSLLHWKADSAAITVGDLDNIYGQICGTNGASADLGKPVCGLIGEQGQARLGAAAGAHFENKIVLAIAIRLGAERYMVNKIKDPKFAAAIAGNQTQALTAKFKATFPEESATIATLDRVSLMTPENIHLNSFMYEPIVDMSDDHLKKLYTDVVALK